MTNDNFFGCGQLAIVVGPIDPSLVLCGCMIRFPFVVCGLTVFLLAEANSAHCNISVSSRRKI
jgi:hypothetical protein